MNFTAFLRTAAVCLCGSSLALAADPKPGPERLVPPRGIPVPAGVRAELEAGAASLSREIITLQGSLKARPDLLALLPDVQIYHQAVRYALEDDIFYKTNEFSAARSLLKEGQERARLLGQGQAPWNSRTGLVVRGYVSRIDGSVQPYGLVVPASHQPGGPPRRLDFWFHGRGDTLSEIAFISGREKSAGEFAPEHTFVLHPYGRFCNAAKFAGEVDAFEALENVRQRYPIDDNRISVRGFSMGGATTWHLGTHYASQWAAVNPGAGFTDVKNYQKLGGKLATIPWYEQKLWRLYDSVDYAVNLVNTTLVAYSGEEDAQKAAADLMQQALAKEGIRMTHIIGPKTGHKYEPEAKKVVAKLVDEAADKGRPVHPDRVRFVTYTLKFDTMRWVKIDALEKHWERASVEGEVSGNNSVTLKTSGVAGLTLEIPAGSDPVGAPLKISIDGQTLTFTSPDAHAKNFPRLKKMAGKWLLVGKPEDSGLAKRHNLQGPIDDAFMDSFVMVRPTGRSAHPALDAWAKNEFAYYAKQWRRQMRGEPRMKDDAAITEADIAASNLILWGDPQSNQVLARIAGKLPIKWDGGEIEVGGRRHAADKFAPAFIFPNPLNPQRYVVINSGFTYSEFGAASNSQQTPKLPDWAVLDLSVPAMTRVNGTGVADAGFFGEHWELPASAK